jgi:hypothetical protein
MDLIGREIFAVGKWNNMEFKEDDLDEIVANFETLKDIHKVPLKFGHNDEQPALDGQPAIGWISRVFREGNKLFADFTNMPKVVMDAIKNKLYRTVSIELLFDVDHKGKRFGHVLDAVALLGADQPAVNTLEDLSKLLAARTSFAGGRRVNFETIAGKGTQTITHKEENLMDEKELKKFISDQVELKTAPIKEELSEVTKERDELKFRAEAAEKAQADFEANVKKEKVVLARETVTNILDTAVREKKMTPAMREVYAKQIGVDDDNRVLEIEMDKVKLMCSATVDAGEQGRSNDDEQSFENASTELTAKTHAYMAEHGEMSFTRALVSVARANPDLHKQYLDSNLGD